VISLVVISRDEPRLAATLDGLTGQADGLEPAAEIVVVDASDGRLDGIRRELPQVRWIDFARPAGVRVSIPHQRNAGVRAARGEIVVFTDAGCLPRPGWLAALVEPIATGGEDVAAGAVASPGDRAALHDSRPEAMRALGYLPECATINMALRRSCWEAVGGFDESFEYGSDIDFSWRLVDAGHRIRAVPDAVVEHDWGDTRRRLRRSFQYGRARARLYRKHRDRRRRAWRTDPMVVAYPLFLLGLPLTLRFPLYPALLAIPAWRNRSDGAARVLADHLVFGAGVLAEVLRR
jgi:GT2 family glycosyltransferase